MKGFFRIILIIACIISFMDCTNMKRKVQESLQSDELLDREGNFYTRAVGWDYYRLPLIDPFEASNTTGNLWLISNDLLSSIEGNSVPVASRVLTLINHISLCIVRLKIKRMNSAQY